MRLKQISVNGLFGLFSHEVNFRLQERVTIVHAPNGYGKTILLRMIAGLFGGKLGIFREVEYRNVTMTFDDGAILAFSQTSLQSELFKSKDRRTFSVIYQNGADQFLWEPDDPTQRNEHVHVSPSQWERWLPNLRRVGIRLWRDNAVGDEVGVEELFERYGGDLPPSVRRPGNYPDWFKKLRASLDCRLIDTQRLMTLDAKQVDYGKEPTLTPAVRTYSSTLASSIEHLLAQSATLSQSLDQSFPNRLLQRMRDLDEPPTEGELRERLSDLQQQRKRLATAGLLKASDTPELEYAEELDETRRRILAAYVADTTLKLQVYEELLSKIELFTTIINSRFQFKSVSIARHEGFKFTDWRGDKLDADHLSSGEQHELVLLFDLIFKSKPDTLILIDEPEISLHIGWQKRFLSDLRQIIALTGIDAIISTHSPQLIGGDLDLVEHLKAPPKGASRIG